MTKSKHNQSGQGLIEYLIIVAIVAVGTLGIMRVMGQNVSAQFANITYALQGNTQRAEKKGVKSNLTDLRDLGNFMNGAASEDSKK